MADDFNIVLEHLKALRAENADVKDSLARIEKRLGSIDRHMLADRQDVTEQRDDTDSLRRRVERIERRLDLHEPEH